MSPSSWLRIGCGSYSTELEDLLLSGKNCLVREVPDETRLGSDFDGGLVGVDAWHLTKY